MGKNVFALKSYSPEVQNTLKQSSGALKGLENLPRKDQMIALKMLETFSLQPESKFMQDLLNNLQANTIGKLEEANKESTVEKTRSGGFLKFISSVKKFFDEL
ncbi:MAG: hypothetical protein A2Y25_03965 [Candidatus Melainabacteria bacterium GWF2_37_15]|nr:MAG: hypothetical protein A2Y25_03965 [Candidatus Melainabacteria bacterium GWF2_37_15]